VQRLMTKFGHVFYLAGFVFNFWPFGPLALPPPR